MPVMMLFGSKVHCKMKNLKPYLTQSSPKELVFKIPLINKVKENLLMFKYDLSLTHV